MGSEWKIKHVVLGYNESSETGYIVTAYRPDAEWAHKKSLPTWEADRLLRK